MRRSLRLFLVVSLLVGAVGLPLAWRSYLKWKTAEVKRLKEELARLWEDESHFEHYDDGSLTDWFSRVNGVEDRLERLTGKRPERPLVERTMPTHAPPFTRLRLP